MTQNKLKYARIQKGITLEKVAKDISIRRQYLEAIEQDNTDSIPKAYLDGYLRIYCKYLGIEKEFCDPDKI